MLLTMVRILMYSFHLIRESVVVNKLIDGFTLLTLSSLHLNGYLKIYLLPVWNSVRRLLYRALLLSRPRERKGGTCVCFDNYISIQQECQMIMQIIAIY